MNSNVAAATGDDPAVLPPSGGFRRHYQFDDGCYIEEDEFHSINLRLIWSALYRNRYLIGAVVAAALLVGLAATLLMTRIYEARVTLQIDQDVTRILGTEDTEAATSVQDADRFLETQLDVIRSRYLAERVAQDLRLFDGDRIFKAMEITAPDESAGGLSLDAAKREKVLDILQENFSVSLPRDSRIARLSFYSPEPIFAAEVANSFARNYITSNLKRKFDTTGYAREFLSELLAEAKRRLEQSEREMLAYSRSAGLINTGGASDDAQPARSLTTTSLVQLNDAYSAAVAERIQAQQYWKSASSTPALALPRVLENPAVQQLIQQRAEQEALYKEQRQRRREDFPTVQQAEARIRELDRQIEALGANIKSGIRQEYEIALQREGALAQNIERLKGETRSEQDRSVRLNILKRETDTNREMYEALLQRFREVSAEAGVTANNISILDRATQPTDPVSPQPVFNMSVAGIGGLALALMLVFLRERFDDAIRSPEEMRVKLGIAPLGVIPILRNGADPRDSLEDNRSELSEAYHTLRASLELSSPGKLAGTILFTSCDQAEGKSTSAFAVARDFARLGRRVLLIDADLRKPSMHDLIGIPNAPGLSSFLAGRESYETIVQASNIAGLSFIPAGPLPPSPAELLAGGALEELLRKVMAEYDLIVVDGPPVMGLADAPLLAAHVGGTVFVIEANRAHMGQAKAALRRLEGAQSRILGGVLTKFDTKTAGYGQNYGYGYRYGD